MRALTLSALLFTLGCAEVPTVRSPDPVGFERDAAIEQGMLDFLNHQSTTVDVLDFDVPLDARAASNLIDHRDGPDGVFGTPDDDRFDTLDEVDAVSWVGPAALDAIESFVLANGWISTTDIAVEGVVFTPEQVQATLALANTAPTEELDDDVGLDVRAVNSIVEARPIDSIETLAGLYYVGSSALRDLRDYEPVATEPQWPGDQFSYDEAIELPDVGSETTAISFLGVPDIDVVVTVVIDVAHPDPGTLTAVLRHPDGREFEVWGLGSSAPLTVDLDQVFGGTESLGDWELTVTDHATGDFGELWGWALEVDAA